MTCVLRTARISNVESIMVIKKKIMVNNGQWCNKERYIVYDVMSMQQRIKLINIIF